MHVDCEQPSLVGRLPGRTVVRRVEIFAESTREPFSSGLAIILLSGLGPGAPLERNNRNETTLATVSKTPFDDMDNILAELQLHSTINTEAQCAIGTKRQCNCTFVAIATT